MAKLPPCGDADCVVHRVFDLLGRPHVLDLLFVLVHEERRPWRFGELRERLDVAASVLSSRLKDLVGVGLLQRTEHAEMPPRVEYEATEDAVELDEAFRALERWGAKRHRVRKAG